MSGRRQPTRIYEYGEYMETWRVAWEKAVSGKETKSGRYRARWTERSTVKSEGTCGGRINRTSCRDSSIHTPLPTRCFLTSGTTTDDPLSRFSIPRLALGRSTPRLGLQSTGSCPRLVWSSRREASHWNGRLSVVG